jgi:hypothetical protein
MNKQDRRIWFFQRLAMVISDLKEQGLEFMPFEFYRDPKQQALDFTRGISEVKKGLHQVWQAIDLVYISKGWPVWKDGPAYIALDVTAKKYGLSTGRNWKSIKDIYHVQSVLGWIDLGLVKG